MQHVDSLSRYPIMTIETDDLSARIMKTQQEDDKIQEIVDSLEGGSNSNYLLRNGLLYRFSNGDDLLVVPASMENDIIRSAHQRGHYAVKRTEVVIKKDYYSIPSLAEKIAKFISNCVPCLVGSRKEGRKESFLHTIDKIELPLHFYHVDHLGPLESTSKQYNHIFAVVDAFTKFVWLYPTKSTTSRELIRLPRANGQIERINRSIIPILTKLSLDSPGKWYQHVNKLQRILNSTFQRSIGMAPFRLLTGVEMRHLEDIKLRQLLEVEWRNQFEESRDDLRLQAKQQVSRIQEENRKTYNLLRRTYHAL